MGLLFLNPIFSVPHGQKWKISVPRGGPEDFKNQLTFVSSAIFGGVMASQTWEHFRLEILVTLYSAQPFTPELPVLFRNFIFYFIILYKCTLQPAAAWRSGLIGSKGCCHLELKCSVLLWKTKVPGYYFAQEYILNFWSLLPHISNRVTPWAPVEAINKNNSWSTPWYPPL